MAALVISIGMQSCKKKENVTPASTTPFNRQAMFSNIGNNIIIPSYKTFAIATDSLYSAANAFINSPDSVTLLNLQQKWLQANIGWKSCELYNFGPALGGTSGGYCNNIQEYFNVTPSAIETVISSTPVPYDSTYVSKQNQEERGISTIEYMLFDPVNGNSAILNQYKANTTNSQQRLNYLKGLTQDLSVNANGLYTAWLPLGGNYIQTFISADGNDVNSSLSLLVNQLVYMSDYIANSKIGIPIGIRVKATNGPPLPTYVETYYSSHALACITADYQSINNLFFGIGNNGVKQSGLSDLLNSMNTQYNGQLLSALVSEELDSITVQINAINLPLEKAVVSTPQPVNKLYLSAKQLLILFKLDVVGTLGLTLTTTDNDGD